jgi:hypothetical protein
VPDISVPPAHEPQRVRIELGRPGGGAVVYEGKASDYQIHTEFGRMHEEMVLTIRWVELSSTELAVADD